MNDSDQLCIGKPCAGKPRSAYLGWLCRSCYARLERNLAETPALVTLVRREFLAPGSGAASDGSRHTKGSPPLPLNAHSLDALHHLDALLGSWLLLVCEERGMRGPDTPGLATNAAPWLLGQLDWLSAQPWIDDLEAELREAITALRSITGQHVKSMTLSKACPYCREHSLTVRADAGSDVVCRTMGCQDERGEQPRWTRATWHLLLGATA